MTFLESDGGFCVVKQSRALAGGALGLAFWWRGGWWLFPPVPGVPSDRVAVILMVCGEEEMCFILESHPAVIKVTSSLLVTKDFSPRGCPVRQGFLN